MNFTSDIKKEILSRGGFSPLGKRAAISALIATGGKVTISPVGFSFVTETENVAEFFIEAFEDAFGISLPIANASTDRMSGRGKLELRLSSSEAETILKDLGLLTKKGTESERIPAKLMKEDGATAYIKGAFLGGGSCTLPYGEGKTGYHLEFVFSGKKRAEAFLALLESADLLAKSVERSGNAVVYVKSKETISDFLSAVGAENALKKFSRLVERRDEANNSNRRENCAAGNADKAALAAVKQVMAIDKLSEAGVPLGGDLSELASARKEHPTMSLKELSEYLKVSKSCLNHRMRKLMELAQKAEYEKKEKEKTEERS